MSPTRHYLDFAATSAVRPDAVPTAMAAYLRACGGTPGRGGHSVAVEAGREALACRRSVQLLLGVSGDPGRVAFAANATTALNTALWGVLREGDAVVVSDLDHNAVLRPVHHLARIRGIEVRQIPASPEGELDLAVAERFIEGARLVVVNSASNVLGTALPVRRLAEMARSAGALTLLDAAQGAGHLPLACEADGVDLAAFTGHKGMLGPQGIGGLWVRPGVEVEPWLRGGTGGDSTRRDMPEAMPDRLEAGTLNAPGVVGLRAGIDYVLDRGLDDLQTHEADLKARLRTGLEAARGVRVLSPSAPDGVGIVTVEVEGSTPAEVADALDRDWGVQCRPGLHCAPDAHRLLGTTDRGALRFSVGWCSTSEDVDRALEGIEAIAGRRRPAHSPDGSIPA